MPSYFHVPTGHVGGNIGGRVAWPPVSEAGANWDAYPPRTLVPTEASQEPSAEPEDTVVVVAETLRRASDAGPIGEVVTSEAAQLRIGEGAVVSGVLQGPGEATNGSSPAGLGVTETA